MPTKTIKEIKRLKKRIFIGTVLCYVNFIVFGSAVEYFYHNRRLPDWIVIVIMLISSILMFPPSMKLSNVQCPRCKARLNLGIFTNIASITCRICGHVVSQKQSEKTREA